MAVFNYFPRNVCVISSLKHSFQIRKCSRLCFRTSEYRVNCGFRTNQLTFQSNIKMFSTKILNSLPFANRFLNLKYFSTSVCRSNEASDVADMKLSFQDMLKFRREQAERSILIEIPNKADISHVFALCKKFGTIKEFHTYTGESSNIFYLIEFLEKESAKNILNSCQCRNMTDAFPVFSRIIKFERKTMKGKGTSVLVDSDPVHDDTQISSEEKLVLISKIIEDIYEKERLPELHCRIRFFFCTLLKESISGLFPFSEAIPFGSTVNGLGRHGCDLDVMIRLYPDQISSDSELVFINKTCVGDIRALQQRAVQCIGEVLRTFFPGISSVHKIIHARMPILKLKHRLLNIECDISVNNMAAVYMSEILYFYGEIDFRIRPLIYTIKKWAKDSGLTCEVPGAWITNFSLVLLAVFFLQNRPIPIVPSINDAILIEACSSSPEEVQLNYVKDLAHWTTAASLNKETLAELLYEFMLFLGTFSFCDFHISVLTGQATIQNHRHPIWVQYPFEEDMNVSKNVSPNEMMNISNTARMSTKYLSVNMQHKIKRTRDLMSLLGLQNLSKQSSNKINVGSLLEETMSFKRKTRVARKVAH